MSADEARDGSPSAAAVVLAAGLGTRSSRPDGKVYAQIGDRPLVAWSLRSLQSSPAIAGIVVVVRADDVDRARRTADEHGITKTTAVVAGGATRHGSERAGVEAAASAIERGEVDLVCVHDAARPFFSPGLLERVLATAHEHGGAIPCLGIEEPFLLRATGPDKPPSAGAAGARARVVSTAGLCRAQTPQAFRARDLLAAHRAASEAGFEGVDTAEVVQRFGDVRIRAVPGEPDNLKVTFAADVRTADRIARAAEEGD